MTPAARALLVEHIKRRYAPEFDMAAHRRALLALPGKLWAAQHALGVALGPEQEALESAFIALHGPHAYQAAMGALGSLAAQLDTAAQQAAAALPKAQSRPALRFAASAWLHVESLEMSGPPALYDAAQGVQELQAICAAAGLHRSAEAVRKALASALKGFDRHCPPFDVQVFLDEIRWQE